MIAKTAPMGWNSWDCYGAAVTEEIVRINAEYMRDNLKEYGWKYVVVDIQWYEPKAKNHEYNHFSELVMDEFSRLLPDPKRFPSAKENGFKKLADDIHDMGLLFGIHIMRGIPRQSTHLNTSIKGSDLKARDVAKFNSICNWNSDMYGLVEDCEGSQAYYNSLFELYASWGVDFVKVDDIANFYPKHEVEMIRKAIANCGRDIVLSLSPGPAKIEEAEHLKQYANLWRITDDFWDEWELLYEMFERADVWAKHSGSGHWPDADMLPIGAILQDYGNNNWTKFTECEQITMMNLWCIIRSPLMIGGDLQFNDKFTLDLLTNKELLKMHNNARGSRQVKRVSDGKNEYIVWIANTESEEKYLGIFNVGETDIWTDLYLIQFDLPEIGTVTDIWSGDSFEEIKKITVSLKNMSHKCLK